MWQYLFQENRGTLFSGIGTLVTECPVMNTLNKRPVTYIALDWFEPSQRSKFDLILFVSLVHINLVVVSLLFSLVCLSSSQTVIQDHHQIYKINELPHMLLPSSHICLTINRHT